MGTKNNNGANPVEKAGLNNGVLYSIRVEDPAWAGSPGVVITEPAELPEGYSANFTCAIQPVPGDRNGSGFNRPEDGAWDPLNPYDFYFQTTASMTAHTRLWRLRFKPGFMSGTITMLINGPKETTTDPFYTGFGPKMLDNMGISRNNDFVLQEDPGNNPILARVWYTSKKRKFVPEVIARHNPDLFGPAGNITQDEESSGVIPFYNILGKGWWLLDVQAHSPVPGDLSGELVERGQLLAMKLDFDD